MIINRIQEKGKKTGYPKLMKSTVELYKLEPYLVRYKCPKCEEGYLIATGIVLTSIPPQYPHECDGPECKHTLIFTDKSYPYVRHEEIGKYEAD